MADTISLLLPYGYDMPTDEELKRSKNYVARRQSCVHGLDALITALLGDAAAEIARICLSYNIDPRRFTISASYNEKMFNQIAEVMDRLEEEILDLTIAYSLRCTESEDRKHTLLPWLFLLGRGNRNLRQTLEARLRALLKDIEAMVAALAYAKTPMTKAIGKARSYIGAVYTMPEVKKAIAARPALEAENIRNGGVKHGNVGSSNSEANNIGRFGTTTVQMAWMRNMHLNFEQRKAAGYYVLRGSSYICALCDDMCGFHPIEDKDGFPPFHPNCCCYAIPVFRTTNND